MMPTPEPIPYHPPHPPIEPHLRTSDGLLAAAEAILARPDDEIDGELRAQACEKLWGAVTRRLRVFADAREWYYCEHSIAHQLVRRIDEALDLDPPELVERFAAIELLHRDGFYEDLMDLGDIRHRMRSVLSFCAMLDDAHRILPLDLAPPNNQRYRRAARRCADRRAQEEAQRAQEAR